MGLKKESKVIKYVNTANKHTLQALLFDMNMAGIKGSKGHSYKKDYKVLIL